MTIFKVLSNLNHNGTVYAKGSLIESENAGQFDVLVNDGVLEIVEGAETVAEAEEAIEKKAAEPEAPAAHETTKPVDTWGPQPDKEVVIPAPTTETAPVAPEVQNTTEGSSTTAGAPVEAPVTTGTTADVVDTTGNNL